jgi:putative restriction endonuclease
LVIITGEKFITGYAIITSIDLKSGINKVRYRCPICHTQEHYSRKGKSPKYKCREKHEFNIPDEEKIIVDEFIANYGSTFIAAKP